MTVVGVVSPGAMGSAFAVAIAQPGRRVVTTVQGRSARTARLAEQAGLEQLASLDEVVVAAEILLSIVPPAEAPHAAAAIADAASRTKSTPLVADLNAISPARVHELATELARAEVELVDGSISGPPPTRPGTTRLYLSGPRLEEVAAIAEPALDVRRLGSTLGTASAVKMCTGSVYKGTGALLAHALLTAKRHGVVDDVLDDLGSSYPQLVRGVPRSLARAATKAERYVGEMEEIARTQADAGLPAELFVGMAAAYAAMAQAPLAAGFPEEVGDEPLSDVLAGLARETQPEQPG
jgi:3-hydroxyisobutyrate dehydrogenase-like beta-hydroxyacid dehydrogenase